MRVLGLNLLLVAGVALGQAPAAPTMVTVQGMVVNGRTGAGVGQAVVSCQEASVMGKGAIQVTADEMGRWSAEVAAGVHCGFRATKSGFFTSAQWAAVRPGMGPVVVKLTPEAAVAGRVVDDEGAPVAGAQVLAFERRRVRGEAALTRVAGRARTGPAGEFRVGVLAAGEYVVRAEADSGGEGLWREAPPKTMLVATYAPGVAESGAAAGILLAAGETREDVEVRLRREAVFRVEVRGAEEPMQLKPVGGDEGVRMAFSPHGRRLGPEVYEYRGVREGRYLVLNQEGGPARMAKVEVAGADVTGVKLEAVAAVEARGRIVVEAAAAGQAKILAGCRVDVWPLWPVRGKAVSAEVGSDGTFTARFGTPGRFRLAERCVRGPGAYLDAVRVGGVNYKDREMERGSGVTEVTVVYRGDGAEVRGEVEGEGAAPVSLVLVPEDWDGTDGQARMWESPGGRTVTANGVAPGRYLVFGIEGGLARWGGSAERVRAKALRLVVQPGERRTVRVPLVRAGEE